MAFNIMDMVTDQITPENIAIVTKFLGIDSSLVTKGISALAPLLLGSILGSTTKPEGKDRFNKAIDEADTGLLGSLAGALTGDGGTALASSGTSMLGSLLGDNKLGSITKAISSFSGLSSGSSTSLLGVAAPMLMGMLSKKKQDDGLDNDGLLSMLNDQKSNIASAFTPEMNQSFTGMGLLDGFADQAGESIQAAARDVSNTAQQAAQAATDTAQHAAKEGKSLFSKLLPFIILALLAWLAYQFFLKPKPEMNAPDTSAITEQISQALTVGDTNIGKDLTSVFGTVTKSLSGINDTDSANAALEGLTRANGALDNIGGLATQLQPAGKSALGAIINKMLVKFDDIVAKVYMVPGAENILGGSISGIRQKLAALANL